MKIERKLYLPYKVMLTIYIVFILFALILDTPGNIVQGLWRIVSSRAILITDYVELGGIGATLINAMAIGSLSVALLVRTGVKPNGAIIMALWLTTGFAFFGKNLFNMLPVTTGVWLFSKYQKEPFMNYSLTALLAATVAPVVSEISFGGMLNFPISIIFGILMGIFAGFIFPPISAYVIRIHGGYMLYNLGFTGGLIACFVATVLKSFGVEIASVSIWSENYTFALAIFLYIISAMLIGFGMHSSGGIKNVWEVLWGTMQQPGRLITDFYFQYENKAFVNMGVLCAAATTLVLLIGGDLNGPTIGGIFTIVGYGAFGKHLRNTAPVVAGALLATQLNMWNPTDPGNMLAILFCTALAPISGQFGWLWGVIAGFLHVNIAVHVGYLNNGLNLYNNGFAAGIVAMFLIPLIEAFRKDIDDEA